jgi:hypothetical protein
MALKKIRPQRQLPPVFSRHHSVTCHHWLDRCKITPAAAAVAVGGSARSLLLHRVEVAIAVVPVPNDLDEAASSNWNHTRRASRRQRHQQDWSSRGRQRDLVAAAETARAKRKRATAAAAIRPPPHHHHHHLIVVMHMQKAMALVRARATMSPEAVRWRVGR